jgi:hypothetical protein
MNEQTACCFVTLRNGVETGRITQLEIPKTLEMRSSITDLRSRL